LRLHWAMGFAQPIKKMSTRSMNIIFWGVERGRCVGLTILTLSLSRLSRQCRILSISQPYMPPLTVTGIDLLLLFFNFTDKTFRPAPNLDYHVPVFMSPTVTGCPRCTPGHCIPFTSHFSRSSTL
jgi:hypothetical protein